MGMTRAKEKLYMTLAYQRMLFGRTQCNAASEFLSEVPVECIEGMAEKVQKKETRSLISDRLVNSMPVLTPKETKVVSSMDSIKAGQKVEHKKWGAGIVVAIDKKPDDVELTIAFDTQGIKKLSAKYAPIEYIS